MNYKNIKIDKSMYKADGGFSGQLERVDPSVNYRGTELEEFDAFQRQLKRFDIKVSGAHSDKISKFFQTSDSAGLFPEYVARSVAAGATQGNILEQITASNSVIDSLDYRSITSDLGDKVNPLIQEGGVIPEVVIKLNENLIQLKKRGRMLSASYEAIKHQRADVLSVALGQIGNSLARSQMSDAINMLILGEGSIPAAKATTIVGTVKYEDLLNLWADFADFEMNTLIASPARIKQLMTLPELRESTSGESFLSSGALITPFGAKIIKTTAIADNRIVAIDKRFALEMVTTGGIQVEYDKLIDTQLERAAVSTTYGFSKLFNDAVRVIKVS